jgi:hypothetical protein
MGIPGISFEVCRLALLSSRLLYYFIELCNSLFDFSVVLSGMFSRKFPSIKILNVFQFVWLLWSFDGCWGVTICVTMVPIISSIMQQY